MKKFLTVALAVLMALTLAACGQKTEEAAPAQEAAPAAEPITLVMAEVNPVDGTICGAMDMAFKEKVEELSGGQILIDLQGGGVLGVEADILDGITGGTGTVDICRISAFALTSYGTKLAKLLSLPYTFTGRDHFWAFTESELGQKVLDESMELGLGIKSLYFGEEGFRHFFSGEGKPIATPADCKGMKIRVSNDPVMVGMVEGLGGTPSPVSMAEIYQAMGNNTIDAAEQPVANYLANSFQETGPNLTLDGHTLGAMMTIITEKAWNKLTPEQQGWVVEAGKYASKVCREQSEAKENAALEQLKAQGINVIEVTDKTAWQEACSKVIAENVTDDLKATYDELLALGK